MLVVSDSFLPSTMKSEPFLTSKKYISTPRLSKDSMNEVKGEGQPGEMPTTQTHYHNPSQRLQVSISRYLPAV